MAQVRGSYRSRYNQEALENAVQRVKLGDISMREACRLYKVPRSTLQDKLVNRVPLNCRSGPSPYLTIAEEANITEWAVRMEKIGYGQTQRDLRQTVKKILDDHGRSTPFKDNVPGKDWMKQFQRRHPELVMRTPQLLGKERAVLSIEVISRWYNQLEDFLNSENATSILTEPGRMFNCDESGFVLGGRRMEKILARKTEYVVTSVGNSNKRQITVLANMSSDGTYLPPMIVFPGVRLSSGVAEGAPEGSYIGRSPTGWMNSEVFFCYIANCFIPFVKQKGVHFPVLLLVDGHKSHLSLEVAELCKENKVILYCLPPHASHVIQPCDLSLFKSLKGKWADTERKYRMENEGAPVSKYTFARVFAKAWAETTCDPTIARNGFRAAGLFPFTKTCMADKLLPATVFVRSPATQDEPARADEGQAPDAVGKSFVSPSLKDHLRFPSMTLPPKKQREVMPHAIATDKYIAHLKTKRQEKEEEKNKIKRKEGKKRKKTEKEEAKKKKKKKKKKTTVSSADTEEAMEVFTCGDCGGVNSSVEISSKLITSTHGVDQGSTYSPVKCRDCHAVVGKVYRTTPRVLDDVRDNYTSDANKLSFYQIGSATTTVSPADDAASSLPNITDLKTIKETMLQLQVLMCTMHQRIANIEQALEIVDVEEIEPAGPIQDIIPQVLSSNPTQKQSNINKDMGRVSQNTSMQLGSNILSSANSDSIEPKERVPSKKRSKRQGVDSRGSNSLEEKKKKRERSTKRLKKSGND